MGEGNKIRISISKEDVDIEPYVREAFADLNCEVINSYNRKSAEDLMMQVMIFLGEKVLSSLVWDLLKAGIGKLFRKYPQINITIRDKEGTMFTVSKDMEVRVVVVPDRKKEFEHIRNIYGLGRYLVEETEDDKLEYRKRLDFVLGIVVTGILSWLINLFSNLYYDVFLTHNARFSSYDSFHLAILVALFFLLIAFLQFLIYDYKNKLTLRKKFWESYLFFLSEDFLPSRFIRILNVFFISMFLIIFDIGTLIALGNYAGLMVPGIVLFVSVIVLIGRSEWFRKRVRK